jgi:dihydroorotase
MTKSTLPLSRRELLAGAALLSLTRNAWSQSPPEYDLLLKGGHLIDAKNRISAVRDVAVHQGKVAAVAESIDAAKAFKVVDCKGLYITPGLIDLHVHVFAGTNERGSYAGDNSVYPDGFTFRVGVTTVVDAGCAGWRNFDVFKDTVIDRSRTRVLALANIVGAGMRGGKFEQNLEDMKAGPTVALAKKYPEIVVGVKCAHYSGPEWAPVEEAVKAGDAAGIPVMVDFGSNLPERPIETLLGEKLRKGDIYTHCFSGNRRELLPDGKLNPGLIAGRKRGVYFDVGHGGGSFKWSVAAKCLEAGFPPDSISTDLHITSMNAGMQDQLNTMSKFLALSESLDDVIAQSTWNPAREVKREDLGHLSPGAIADISVFSMATGDFGFFDSFGGRQKGSQKLTCEMTFKDGLLAWDLNGRTRQDWRELPLDYSRQGDSRWDGILNRQRRRR